MSMFSKSQGSYGVEALVEQGGEEHVESHLEFDENLPQDVQQFSDNMEAEVETMNEVQIRMKKAEYYNLLLQNPLFGPHEHHLATEVETEVREFVMDRLRVFLGMRPEGKGKGGGGGDFDAEQTQALAMWANKLLKRPAFYGLESNKKAEQQAAPPQVNVASLKPSSAPQPPRVATTQQKTMPAPRQLQQQRQPAPRRQTPPQPQQEQGGEEFDVIVHPVTGKPVRVSKQVQVKPQGQEQPKATPVSGDFAGTSATPNANGGFVDMTGGRASPTSQAIAHGNIGGMTPGIQGQLVDFFLKNK